MEELNQRDSLAGIFMEKIMERIVFENKKEEIALKLELRKEIIHEIRESCKCRKCPHFRKYLKNNGVSIENKRN